MRISIRQPFCCNQCRCEEEIYLLLLTHLWYIWGKTRALWIWHLAKGNKFDWSF